MLDKITLKKIADQLAIDVDNYCDKKWADEERRHLGFSLIGDECQRKLWYGFRWAGQQKPSPRVKRLFNRGHLEEERFVDYLRGIGCEVYPFDNSYRLINETHTNNYKVMQNPDLSDSVLWQDVSDDFQHIKKANDLGITYPVQWKVSAVNGHCGGSLDGLGYLPKHYGINEQILFEFKTHNEKSFNALKKDGMMISKPLHYAQCCGYGYLKNINYVCYVAVCKNDDELYFEILPLNHKTGEMMVWKADRIIRSQEPPPKLQENPTFWKCKSLCGYYYLCFGKGNIEKNCRSCKHAVPIENKQWGCTKHNQILTDEIIKQEWECWESIV